MRASSISLASSRVRLLDLRRERCACRLHLARGVGARLFGVPGQVAPELLVLADELRPCLLGFAGELGGLLPGLGRCVAGDGLDLRRFALALGADRRGFAFRAGAHLGGFGRDGAADGRSLAQGIAGLMRSASACARASTSSASVVGTIEYCLRLVRSASATMRSAASAASTTQRLDLALDTAAQPSRRRCPPG